MENRHAQARDDLKLRAGEATVRPFFFRGKKVGEHITHDDRALIYLIGLAETARRREEDRAERREIREHELRLRAMDIEAR